MSTMNLTRKYEEVYRMKFQGPDCEFTIIVDRVFNEGPKWMFDPMCDAHNVVRVEDTAKKRVAIIPSLDRFHNEFGDFEEMDRTISTELAREFCRSLLHDDDRSCWFAKDMLSYAAKYGKLRG